MVLLSTATPDLPAAAATQDRVPLAVDLDGTVLRTDSLVESLVVLARNKPASLWRLPGWLMPGLAHFKQQLAATAMPEIGLLPHRAAVVEFLRAEKQCGRTLILATAADQRLAAAVEQDLHLFDSIFASDGTSNLSGRHKRDRLVAAFGTEGFDYLGNSSTDAPVWAAARRALLATPSRHLARRIARTAPVAILAPEGGATWRDHLRALRPLHWVKNILVVVPLAAVHRLFDGALAGHAALAFLAFCLCASGIYLINDLLDLPADRRHPHKKERMLASGRIPLAHALIMMPLLMLGAFAIAIHLSMGFAAVLLCYTTLMIAYSMRLKDIPLVDVLVLAVGYSLRIAAGSLATGVRVSAWLLMLCVFLFFSLALIKRYAELIVLDGQPGIREVRARGYRDSDKGLLVVEGIASGYLAVMVLALYTNSEIAQRLYAGHDFFWGICLLLLYWVSYLWLMATRGRIHVDPVIFALSDRGSLWAIAAMGLLTALAL